MANLNIKIHAKVVFWNNLVAYSWYSADKWIDVLHKLFYFTTEVLRLWIRIHFELFKRIHFEMPVPLLHTDFSTVREAAVGWFHWMCRCYYTWSSIKWEFIWHLWGNNHCLLCNICTCEYAMQWPTLICLGVGTRSQGYIVVWCIWWM